MEDVDKNKLSALIQNAEARIDSLSKKEIDIVLAPMGAGKSTFTKNNLMDEKKIFVSIDDYIPDISSPEYTSEDLYRRSRRIGIEFTDYLLGNHISMIIEGTGKNADMIDYMKRLKSDGYYIRTYLIKTPLDVCIDRVKVRNKSSDRKVSISAVRETYRILWEENADKIIEISDEYKNIEKGSDFNTNNIIIHDSEIDKEKFTTQILKQEPQFYQSSISYCLKNCGAFTALIITELLDIIQKEKLDPERIRIDTQLSMLAPGWYPSIPGWHCNFVTKNNDGIIQPDSKEDQKIKHFILLTDSPLTEFIKNRNIIISKKTTSWNDINAYIETLTGMETIKIPPLKFVEFTSNELHRTIPAYHNKGIKWRYLFRASYFPEGHIASKKFSNEIRTQTQVYIDINAASW